jgi:hypothetical protein
MRGSTSRANQQIPSAFGGWFIVPVKSSVGVPPASGVGVSACVSTPFGTTSNGVAARDRRASSSDT